MCYMTTRYRKMVDELAAQLEPDEQVEDVALFNSIPTMCGYFAFAAVSFAVGRLFPAIMRRSCCRACFPCG